MLTYLNRLAAALLLACLATFAAAQSEYRVQPGDTIAIEVLEDGSLNRSVVVLPDGRFSFPFAGTVRAAGRTVSQIEASVTAGIAENFADQPTVFVSIVPRERRSSGPAAARTIDIYFLGEVNTPGLREVAPGTTMLQALAQSGGLTRFAATKRIQLRRSDSRGRNPRIIPFNYKALTDGASLASDITLKDGDVILVPERRLFE